MPPLPNISLLLFLYLFIHFTRGGVIVTHADGSKVEIDAWYSTLGNPSDSPNKSYPVTFLSFQNLTCQTLSFSSPSFDPPSPPSPFSSSSSPTSSSPSSSSSPASSPSASSPSASSASSPSSSPSPPLPPEHFLIIPGDLLEEVLFHECTNHFFDAYANGVLVASAAQSVGMAGILIEGKVDEKQYSNYRVVGFNDKITIPFLVMPKESTQYFRDNLGTVKFVSLPEISADDRNFISRLRRAYKAWALFDSISWTLVLILTFYLSVVDIIKYVRAPKANRSLHPFLTKASPCMGALLGVVWYATDPFSFELKVHFPAYFFGILHAGFLVITACLLLKTWILTVGDRLKSPRFFRISILFITGLTIVQALVVLVWVFGGKKFYWMGIIFGGFTVFICGVGFIYYGKDIVWALSTGEVNPLLRNLNIKIIIFTVIFVVFSYAFVILYALEVWGGCFTQFIGFAGLSFAFFVIYSVLFLRKSKNDTNEEETRGGIAKKNANEKEMKRVEEGQTKGDTTKREEKGVGEGEIKGDTKNREDIGEETQEEIKVDISETGGAGVLT